MLHIFDDRLTWDDRKRADEWKAEAERLQAENVRLRDALKDAHDWLARSHDRPRYKEYFSLMEKINNALKAGDE